MEFPAVGGEGFSLGGPTAGSAPGCTGVCFPVHRCRQSNVSMDGSLVIFAAGPQFISNMSDGIRLWYSAGAATLPSCVLTQLLPPN